MTINIQSKEVLAKLLATENLTVVHQNVSTASFHTKDRVLTLPMWDDMKNFTYDHLVGHEVGHALHTDSEMWVSAIEKHGKNFKGFYNIVEDARIEKLVQRTYPGLKRSFTQSYKKMLADGFFGRDEQEIDTFELIDRINVYFKCGMSTGTKFADDEKKWLDVISKIETQEDAEKVALELFELAKEKKEKEQQAQQESEEEMEEDGEDDDNFSFGDSDMDHDDYDNDEDGDDSAEDGSGEGEEQDSDQEEDSLEELKSSGEQGEDDAEEIETPTKQASNSRVGATSPDPLDPSLPIAETDSTLEDNIKTLSPDSDHEVINITLDMNSKAYEDRIFDFKKILATDTLVPTLDAGSKMYKDFQVNNKKAINYMVKEFEMKKKASEYKRATVSKTGVLDTLKMNNYKFSDDIFKKMTIIPDGKNHGLVMFLDWSGSMAYNLGNTVDQLLNLVSFCRQVQIPFQVYAFNDNSTLANQMFGAWDKRVKSSTKVGHTVLNTDFHLLKFFDNKMSRTEFQKMCAFTLAVGKYWENRYKRDNKYGEYWVPRKFWLGGTPLNDAILSAHTILQKFQKENRIDIVNTVFLTDGASNHSNYNRLDNVASSISPYNGTWIFTNPITKKQFRIASAKGSWSGTEKVTPMLLKSLADYTGTNVIGFHILPRNKRTALQEMGSNISQDIKETMWGNMIQDGFVVNTSSGYTKQFLIQSSKLATSNGAIIVDDGATKGKIRQAFKKATTGSRTSRVMLSQFIELVA